MHDDVTDWDAAAATYVDIAGGDTDDAWNSLGPVVTAFLGDLAGQRILDIGCGHAWLARTWCEQGAAVVGIDSSAAMLARAEPHHRLDLHRVNIAEPFTPHWGTFDIAVASMVLHDLHDITPALAAAAQSLRPGGRFIATIPHPAFYNYPISLDVHTGQWTRQVAGYLRAETWRIERFGGHNHYHRPLSTYINAITAAGLAVTGFHEPVHHSRKLDNHMHMPLFAAITASAPPGSDNRTSGVPEPSNPRETS